MKNERCSVVLPGCGLVRWDQSDLRVRRVGQLVIEFSIGFKQKQRHRVLKLTDPSGLRTYPICSTHSWTCTNVCVHSPWFLSEVTCFKRIQTYVGPIGIVAFKNVCSMTETIIPWISLWIQKHFTSEAHPPGHLLISQYRKALLVLCTKLIK